MGRGDITYLGSLHEEYQEKWDEREVNSSE